MIREVRVVPYGRPAGEALAATVAAAKETGGALAPVTVVVASNFAGLSARRLLAGGTAGGRGVANVQFVTPFRLAELLSGDLLHDRRPITNPVLASAVRRGLAEEPGPFAAVAQHHATEAALAALYGELSHVSEAGLASLETAGDPAALAVRTFRAISARLGGFHGEDDVARAAAGRADLAEALVPFGHLVSYLPEPLTPALGGLIRAVLVAAESSVVVGLTGAEEADAPVIDACVRAGVEISGDAAARAGIRPPVGSHIVSVTDADEEVRAVVRRIAALMEDGVGLDRIGVFHPAPDPYVHTLEQQFEAAGIPANGPSRERLADSVAGRTLLGALALPGERWRRDRVMALVAGGPVRHGERRVFPSAWENLSRRAGVVGELSDWRHKLETLRAAMEEQIGGTDAAERAGKVAFLQRQRDDAGALAEFVDDLATAVGTVTSARGWPAKTGATRALLHHLLGPEHRRGTWPDREQDAATRVEQALDRLAALDELEPDPSPETFRRALTSELDVSRGRAGRYGNGVVYGPLAGAAGHDLDAVFIVGLAEGQCPAPRRDDSLLPDSARELVADGELPLRAGRLHDQHRAFLAALAAAPPGRRYLTFPRGDLRGGRHRLPSRWLLDTATARAGITVYSTDFAKLDAPVVDVVASHAAGVLAGPAAASGLDRDLAALAAHVAGGGDPARHPAAATLQRGFDCIESRPSDRFTEWDGNLAGHQVPSPASGRWLSPTGLETFATCGFRYFLGQVLGLRKRDDPERVIELGALPRGSAMHAILEAFYGEVIRTAPPDPVTPWSGAHRARLQAIAEGVFAELEQTGKTGRPVHWRLERERLLRVLDQFLDEDDGYRREFGARPHRVELPFGSEGVDPVEIELDGGRVIRFKGFADRVDDAGGGHYIVLDYKTGKGDEYKKLATGDPVKGGAVLQLGLYSEAAVQLLGAHSADAHYWMINEQAKFARYGYPWDGDRRARFVSVITAMVDGIEQGAFPAVPGEMDTWRNTHENCTWCPFDDLCPRDRGEFAEAKAGASELEVRLRLGYEPPAADPPAPGAAP